MGQREGKVLDRGTDLSCGPSCGLPRGPRSLPYFTAQWGRGKAGIFCLHNIYPTASAESNGLRFPGETNEIGTKTTPLSGASLRRTDDVECGHRDKFQRNRKIVQSAQTQMLAKRAGRMGEEGGRAA